MQNWKLISNTAQTVLRTDGSNQADIKDSGFASFSHPKLKFNFTIDIELRVPLLGGVGSTFGAASMSALDIPVKTVTRPSPTISYTDVNYYNYRTKVATKTEYGTASVTFYDDSDDRVQNLYKTYLNYVSPISKNTDYALLSNPETVPFGQLSSLGPLPSNAKSGLIRLFKIHHFYKHKNKLMRTTYTHMNPKINSFQPDELSMSESDVNTMTLEFNYDGLNISTVEMP